MQKLHVYAQSGYPTKKAFLTDEAYKEALLAFVKYCHDLIIVGSHDLKFYLPERRADKARAGVWFVGGAVHPFIPDILTSLAAVVKRETKLVLPAQRYIHWGQVRTLLNAKDNNGVAHSSLSEIYLVTLSEEEIGQVRLEPTEYVGNSLRPYGIEEIEAIPDPFTREIFRDLFRDIHAQLPFLRG